GETWVEKETGTDQFISDLWFTEDGSTGYLLCFEDTILKTIDYGDTWEVQVPIEGEFYRGFDFLNEDFGVVIGNDFVFRTLDGGETWEERPFFEANSNLRCVDIVNDSLSYIGSTNTLISRNGGGFWDSISVSTSLFTDKMEFLNDSLGYMVSGTNVRVTSDSGRHWSSVTTACLNNSWSLDELDVIDEHHVHVVGDSPMRRMWSGPRSIKTKVMDDSYCLGEKINVGFYYDGYYINDNTYQAQLSDADGDFSSSIIIGSYFNDFVNRSPSGVISCEVPSGLPEGDGYRIRVVAVNPETFGSDNGFNISLVNSLQPSVELSYEAIGCGGTELDFNTESSQTGVIQTYSWQVNGESIAHTGMSWSVDSLLEGDVVQVLLNMQSACTDDEVISNSVIVPEVNSPTLIISEDVTIDQGQTIQLSASGFSEYEWTPSDFLNDPNIADPTSTPDSTITYTVVGTDEQGCTAVDSVTITVIPIVDGLYEERLKWIVSPNPVVDELYLSLNRNISGEILIISMDGSLLEQNTLNGKRARIEMSDYPTGIYILEVRENIGSHYIKIAKVN
ncbi:MAG: T9SS type A sorting domain-containing protein, partial [Flavobacteriales bacterium]|nr:T9SS type A sorting domain-containing protein [Flavobacteriales bacterium]